MVRGTVRPVHTTTRGGGGGECVDRRGLEYYAFRFSAVGVRRRLASDPVSQWQGTSDLVMHTRPEKRGSSGRFGRPSEAKRPAQCIDTAQPVCKVMASDGARREGRQGRELQSTAEHCRAPQSRGGRIIAISIKLNRQLGGRGKRFLGHDAEVLLVC